MPHVTIDHGRLTALREVVRRFDAEYSDLQCYTGNEMDDWIDDTVALLRAVVDPRVELPDTHDLAEPVVRAIQDRIDADLLNAARNHVVAREAYKVWEAAGSRVRRDRPAWQDLNDSEQIAWGEIVEGIARLMLDRVRVPA